MVLHKFAVSMQYGGRHAFVFYFPLREQAEARAVVLQRSMDMETAARRARPKGQRKGVAGKAHVWEKVA